jgi:putative DNA primase/helicase
MADARYFHKHEGLKAFAAANAVRDLGPVRWGPDRTFWCYLPTGVWHSDDDLLHARIVRTLEENYRPAHSQVIRDVLRSEVGRIDIEPLPQWINMSNGMLDWNAVVAPNLVQHQDSYLSTVQLPVAYRRGAACHLFDEFLDWAVAPEDVLRVWEILGYLMMSGNPLQRAVLMVGGGGNGKGVLLEVIKKLLGDTNCTSIPLHDFADNRFVTAELFGRLANVCGDIDATWIENTSRIKEITGEDTVMGERKGQDPFYFRPWCKMVFSANDIPGSADSSRGWTRRFEVVNFPNTPTITDRTLKDRLTTPASLSGIALKAVMALRGLMERGDFTHGAARDAANRRFAERSNTALRWLGEACRYPVEHAEAWTRSTAVWEAAKPWLWAEGSPLKKQGFYSLLKQVPGVAFVKHNGYDGFRGFALPTTAAPVAPEPTSGLLTAEQMGLDLRLSAEVE